MGRVLGAEAGIPGHDCSHMSPHLASPKVRSMMQMWSSVLAGGICSTRSNFCCKQFPAPTGVSPYVLTGGISMATVKGSFSMVGHMPTIPGQRRSWGSLKITPICQLLTRPPFCVWFWPWQFSPFITQWYLVCAVLSLSPFSCVQF